MAAAFRILTALPDTRSWQVPKAYRVSTPEPTVCQLAGRNVYNPCHTGFPAHTPGGVIYDYEIPDDVDIDIDVDDAPTE